MEREKLQTQEDSLRLSAEKGRLDRSLGMAERELAEAQQRIRLLQVGGPLLAQVGGGCRWWHPWMLPPRSMHPLLAVEWGWAPFGAHPSLGRCWRFY